MPVKMLLIFFYIKIFRNQKINFIANKCVALIFFCMEIMTTQRDHINILIKCVRLSASVMQKNNLRYGREIVKYTFNAPKQSKSVDLTHLLQTDARDTQTLIHRSPTTHTNVHFRFISQRKWFSAYHNIIPYYFFFSVRLAFGHLKDVLTV